MTTFARLGLPDPLLRALRDRGVAEPFPIQAAAIPDALAGRDVRGKAPTGSGKTLAFGLPPLAGVDAAARNRPRALVLAPTRELAQQISEELAPLAQAVRRRVFAIYGGVGYGPQKARLRSGVDVLVATPGRLEDLIEQRSVDLGAVDIVVVDEADRMADMGFLPAARRILDRTASQRQTLLFSATLDGDVPRLPGRPRAARGRDRGREDRRRHPPLLAGGPRRPARPRRRRRRGDGAVDRVHPHPPRRRPARQAARPSRRRRGIAARGTLARPAHACPGGVLVREIASAGGRRRPRHPTWTTSPA